MSDISESDQFDSAWDRFDDQDWLDFASDWLVKLRTGVEPPDVDIDGLVVDLSFSAAPHHQWRFIEATVAGAETDSELGHIAAGPMEHILGWHGPDWIDVVEQRAKSDRKFERMLTGVWRYRMSDEIWARVEALQEKARVASNVLAVKTMGPQA